MQIVFIKTTSQDASPEFSSIRKLSWVDPDRGCEKSITLRRRRVAVEAGSTSAPSCVTPPRPSVGLAGSDQLALGAHLVSPRATGAYSHHGLYLGGGELTSSPP